MEKLAFACIFHENRNIIPKYGKIFHQADVDFHTLILSQQLFLTFAGSAVTKKKVSSSSSLSTNIPPLWERKRRPARSATSATSFDRNKKGKHILFQVPMQIVGPKISMCIVRSSTRKWLRISLSGRTWFSNILAELSVNGILWFSMCLARITFLLKLS